MKKLSTRLLSLLLVVMLLASVVPFGAFAAPVVSVSMNGAQTVNVDLNGLDETADNIKTKLEETYNDVTVSGSVGSWTATGTLKPVATTITITVTQGWGGTKNVNVDNIIVGSEFTEAKVREAVMREYPNDEDYTYSVLSASGVANVVENDVTATAVVGRNALPKSDVTISVTQGWDGQPATVTIADVKHGTAVTEEMIREAVLKNYEADSANTYSVQNIVTIANVDDTHKTTTAMAIRQAATVTAPNEVTLHYGVDLKESTTKPYSEIVGNAGMVRVILPTANDEGAKKFSGWATTASGSVMYEGGKSHDFVATAAPTDLYAVYVTGSTANVELKVQAVYWADNRKLPVSHSYVIPANKSDKTIDLLVSNKTALKNTLLSPAEYAHATFSWSGAFHTTENGSTQVTDSNTKLSEGSKTVYINVRATTDSLAKVQIHYYKNVTTGSGQSFEMNGVLKEEFLTKSDIAAFLNKKTEDIAVFTNKADFDEARAKGDKNWNTTRGVGSAKMDEAVNEIWVIGNGSDASRNTNWHKTAGSSSSSSGNKTNTIPKTGDNIHIAFTAMTLSAAALAAGYVVSKKRKMF